MCYIYFSTRQILGFDFSAVISWGLAFEETMVADLMVFRSRIFSPEKIYLLLKYHKYFYQILNFEILYKCGPFSTSSDRLKQSGNAVHYGL